MTKKPTWQTSADSAALAKGHYAARQLQTLPLPPTLAKQIANYICATESELASRGINPETNPEAAPPRRP